MDWGWLKIIIEKLRIYSLIGALFFIALCAVLFTKDSWILIVIGSASFLVIEFAIYIYDRFEKKRNIKRKNIKAQNQYNEEEQKYKDLVWYFFLGLNGETMRNILAVFDSPKDPSDKYVRIFEKYSSLSQQLNSYKYQGYGSGGFFEINIDDRYVIHCLEMKDIGDSVVVTINPYFYALIEEYFKTGRKIKI